MITVTGLPSGQRLVWALHTFTKSGTEMVASELALLETTARSRAAAIETLTATNSEVIMNLRDNTLVPPRQTGTRVDSEGFWLSAQRNQGHVGQGIVPKLGPALNLKLPKGIDLRYQRDWQLGRDQVG